MHKISGGNESRFFCISHSTPGLFREDLSKTLDFPALVWTKVNSSNFEVCSWKPDLCFILTQYIYSSDDLQKVKIRAECTYENILLIVCWVHQEASMCCQYDYEGQFFPYTKCWRQKTPVFFINSWSYISSKDSVCRATHAEFIQITAVQQLSPPHIHLHLASWNWDIFTISYFLRWLIKSVGMLVHNNRACIAG